MARRNSRSGSNNNGTSNDNPNLNGTASSASSSPEVPESNIAPTNPTVPQNSQQDDKINILDGVTLEGGLSRELIQTRIGTVHGAVVNSLDGLTFNKLELSEHISRLLNEDDNKGHATLGITHAVAECNRHVFSTFNGDTGQVGTDGSGLMHRRTRVKLKTAHLLKNANSQVTSIEDVDLHHHSIISAMSDNSIRNRILDTLTDPDTVRRLVTWLIGTGRDAKLGVKRYNMGRLYRQMSSVMGLGGTPFTNPVILTAGRLLHEVLIQFDWHFSTLKTDEIEEPVVRLMRESDITKLYVEGWMAKKLPASQYWVMKYAGSDRVMPEALEELIIASFVNLRRQLMHATLLSNRVKDVLNMARLKVAVDIGLIPDISNEMVAACLESSPDLADMAGWLSIIEGFVDLNNPISLNIASEGLSTNIGDLNLFLKIVNEVATCVREHDLVVGMPVGDLIKHLTVKHYSLDDGGIYHSAILGNVAGTNTNYYHYIEDRVGADIYSHLRIRENDQLTLSTTKAMDVISHNALGYIAEYDNILANSKLSTIVEPSEIWGNAPLYMSLINVTNDEVKTLAMLNRDILISYVVTKEVGNTIYSVNDVQYVIDNVSDFLVNPYPLITTDVYTKSALVAAVTLSGREGKGASILLNTMLDEIKSNYLSRPISNVGSRFVTAIVPSHMELHFTITDEARNSKPTTVRLRSDNYITMNSSGDTIAFIPDQLLAQSTLSLYAMQLASGKARFSDGATIGFDDERNNASFMNVVLDQLMSIPLAKQIAYDARFNIARELSNSASSWSSTYHNIQVNALTMMEGANAPLRYLFSAFNTTDSISLFNWFNSCYNNNRLFRDLLLGKVTTR